MRGTVRDCKNPKKIAILQKAFGSKFADLELVNADLMDQKSLTKAIEGASYVVHTASPMPLMPPKTEEEVIRPAVEGTMAVLRACQ